MGGIPKNGKNRGWFKKGRQPSDKEKRNLSERMKGKTLAQGYKHTEEWKKEQSQRIRGQNHPYFGKHHTEETKKKISETLKKKGIKPKVWFNAKGYKHSIESRKRMSEGCKGEKHWRWQGGIEEENKRVRKGIEFRLWRESVFSRDGWTCQKYGIIGARLHPHHINNFAEKEELRFAIDNGITLSEKAHKEFHKKYGFKNNTQEQLEEFLKESTD